MVQLFQLWAEDRQDMRKSSRSRYVTCLPKTANLHSALAKRRRPRLITILNSEVSPQAPIPILMVHCDPGSGR
jgi:hypothetical protein